MQSNGIRKTFVCATPGRAGKAEVHRKADDWLSSQLVDSDAPISTVWNRWAATLTSKDAIKKADIFWRHYISAACGKKRMSDITEGLIQSIIDGAAAKGLAWKSISNIRATVSAFIKWSRKNKYTDIVMDDIGIPKTAKKGKKKILQPDDLIKMWNAPEALYSNLYKADVVIGFRPGEAIGLQWSDIVETVCTFSARLMTTARSPTAKTRTPTAGCGSASMSCRYSTTSVRHSSAGTSYHRGYSHSRTGSTPRSAPCVADGSGLLRPQASRRA